LLRRYGHVDQVPLPDGSLGNPADIVEIRADLVVKSITQDLGSERVDWWLEQGGDELRSSPYPLGKCPLKIFV
jgi:N-lysine methyltransferase SETD6